jgi:hypothetical protein
MSDNTPQAAPVPLVGDGAELGAGAPRVKPKRLTSRIDRRMARNIRDRQWEFMARVADLGTLWVCWWNKDRHHDREKASPDLFICGLIDGCELIDWLHSHDDWWIIGEWSEERYAAPVSLTDAGRVALAEREKYDMELVTGGMVEPGWCAMPTAESKNHGK